MVGQLNYVSQIVPQPTLVALLPWQRNLENLKTKVGYNAACIRDIANVLASDRGVLGVWQLNGVNQIPLRQFWLPWQRN